MDTIYLKANAKVNLALDVLKKRQDGYHEVRMIMQTINLYDKLELKKTISPEIKIKTNLPFLPVDENNLAYAAAKLLKDTYEIKDGLFISLEKKIPVAAGMAGGSADAAAILHGMNELFELNLSLEKLQQLGVTLGADIPYCLLQGTALSEGIGEILTSLPPLPKCQCLVVKPAFNVSTPYAYRNLTLDEDTLHPDVDGMIKAIQSGDLSGITERLGNTLESVILPLHPEVEQIKQEMKRMGAENALMSGSGPTVFGIFSDSYKAEKAFYQFKIGSFGRQTYLTDI